MIGTVGVVLLLSCSCLALRAPSLQIRAEDTIVDLGDAVELPCLSTGDPTPTVFWLKDNITYSGGIVQKNGSLMIQNFREEDEGYYHCTVKNELGSIRSPEAVVLRSFYRSEIENKVVHRSEILVVSQKADIDISKLSARWTIRPTGQQSTRTCPSNDCPAWVRITPVDRFTAVSVIRFDYSEIIRAFPGETQFLVTTKLGDLPTKRFSALFSGLASRGLSLDVPPVDTTVAIGQDALLHCISNAENATYAWTKNASPLNVKGDKRMSLVVDGSLRIERVTVDDVGLYQCTVNGPSYRPGTKSAEALLSVFSKPQVVFQAVISDDSGFRVSCYANGTAPMDVDLLCNGRVRLMDEVTRDDFLTEITTDRVLVTKDSVCQCLVYNDYGSVQDSVYINVTGGRVNGRSTPRPPKDNERTVRILTATPRSEATKSPGPDVNTNLAENAGKDGLSDGELAGLVIAIILLIIIVIALVIFALHHNKKPRPSRRELTTSDIGDPVPSEQFVRSVHGDASRAHKQISPQSDNEHPDKSKPDLDDSRRNSRNDFSGTSSGAGLLEFTVLAGSQDSLKAFASKQPTEASPGDNNAFTMRLQYEDPDSMRPGKDKQTRTSVVALRKDGYAVVEEDVRTQQNVVVELHPGSPSDRRKPRVGSRPVPVGSGEYARLDPLPQPKHSPPVPPKSSTPSSAVPYGIDDDWHFVQNGDEYAIAEVAGKRKSSPSDVRDTAYAISDLPQEENAETRHSVVTQTGSRPQPNRAEINSGVTYAILMPDT